MWAKGTGLDIFLLPPHTTHMACPLDTHVFKGVASRWDACRTKNPRFLGQPLYRQAVRWCPLGVLRRWATLQGLCGLNAGEDGGQNGLAQGPQAAPGGSPGGGSPHPGGSKDNSPPHTHRLRLQESSDERELTQTEPTLLYRGEHP